MATGPVPLDQVPHTNPIQDHLGLQNVQNVQIKTPQPDAPNHQHIPEMSRSRQ
jgi:hypothetical protein